LKLWRLKEKERRRNSARRKRKEKERNKKMRSRMLSQVFLVVDLEAHQVKKCLRTLKSYLDNPLEARILIMISENTLC
jgi:hypothetical protein